MYSAEAKRQCSKDRGSVSINTSAWGLGELTKAIWRYRHTKSARTTAKKLRGESPNYRAWIERLACKTVGFPKLGSKPEVVIGLLIDGVR